MDTSRLQQVLSDRKISKRKLAMELGMSYAGLWRAIKKDTLRARDLHTISNILNVPMGYLYGEETKPGAGECTWGLVPMIDRLIKLENPGTITKSISDSNKNMQSS